MNSFPSPWKIHLPFTIPTVHFFSKRSLLPSSSNLLLTCNSSFQATVLCGLGSVLAQLLHIFCLVDPSVIIRINLQRLLGSSKSQTYSFEKVQMKTAHVLQRRPLNLIWLSSSADSQLGKDNTESISSNSSTTFLSTQLLALGPSHSPVPISALHCSLTFFFSFSFDPHSYIIPEYLPLLQAY